MKKIVLAFCVMSFAVFLGVGSAYLAHGGYTQLFGWPMLPALAVLAFAIQWLVFVPSYWLQTEHYYDLTGSATYLLCIGLAIATALQQGINERAVLLALITSVWALRLGSFLFKRVKRTGKDGRFDDIKTFWPRFMVAWTIQGLWVFWTLLAALIAISNAPKDLEVWAFIGTAVWLLGFAFEAVADAQKTAFNSQPANRGKFIQQGLWAWSRHPNYFGEIVLWIGVAIIAIPTFSGWQFVGLISPLFVIFLLTKVSGIPLLQARAQEKWGEDPAFQRYIETTPVLVPRPPKK